MWWSNDCFIPIINKMYLRQFYNWRERVVNEWIVHIQTHVAKSPILWISQRHSVARKSPTRYVVSRRRTLQSFALLRSQSLTEKYYSSFEKQIIMFIIIWRFLYILNAVAWYCGFEFLENVIDICVPTIKHWITHSGRWIAHDTVVFLQITIKFVRIQIFSSQFEFLNKYFYQKSIIWIVNESNRVMAVIMKGTV